ncbi:hypothetical protein ABD91_20125 [Lysinibacillus sphaericus]|uniref:type II secretion system F family protein n=1 Tax=Lysinibacillus sphaericus TaxID=1421 RepID=UPI0018CCA382|nr:hypothetical protein [Lysinibacillus sphaericus]MBG9693067.1 hypothetical protein [Lysinibacillus sphaericus]
MGYLFPILTVMFLMITGYVLSKMFKENSRKQSLVSMSFDGEDFEAFLNDQEDGNSNKNKFVFYNPIRHLKNVISDMYKFFPNPQKKNLIFSGIVFLEVILFIGMVIMGKFFMALVLLVIVHFMAIKLIKIKTMTIKDHVQEELPSAIRHVIKVLTKTDDLGQVFLEASKGMKEPMRSKFVEISRIMVTRSGDVALDESLMKFAKDSESIWAYTFAFIIKSYRGVTGKVEILRNLNLLCEMMDEENRNAEKRVTERKPIVVLNNVLGALAALSFFANLWKNDYAYTYFFQTPTGVLSMVGGVALIGATLMVNFVVGKKTY